MHDQRRTKAQLCAELAALRAHVAEIEQARVDPPCAGEQIDQRLPDRHDARARQRVEHMLECQRRFFEQLATGAPLSDLLDILTRTVESQIDGGLCSIMLLDEEGRHLRNGAAPSLPQAYVRAIDGSAIGPNAGSCGAAAFRGELVIVADIACDPLWVDYRALALPHGLHACWSAPFCDSRGRVLGTLAVYYRTTRSPIAAEIEEVKQAAYLASVAVERTRAEMALRTSEQRYRLVSRATNDVIWDWDIVNQRLEWNECAQTLFGYTADDVGSYPLWWDEHLHPDDRERASAGVLAVIESGGQFWSGEYRFRRADQTYAHVLDRGYIVRDEAGRPVRMIGAMQNITARKRAEEALQASEEAARCFQEQLKELHALSIELSAASSFDDLCRMAIELGRSRLGFDRLGLWFIDEHADYMLGAFGTDEHGQIRDERRRRIPVAPSPQYVDFFAGKTPLNFGESAALYNDNNQVVGRGWSAMAALWDGDRVIGQLSTDNLLKRRPITQYQLELLGLYSSTLGHLCARKRAEEALREREESARDFQELLKTLHMLSSELSSAASFDDLCHMAVELGHSRLGFDRLGLWFLDDDQLYMRGSFGMNEYGQIRDERGNRYPVAESGLLHDLLNGNQRLSVSAHGKLFNHRREVVGQGWRAMAALWDGARAIGYISTDNLVDHRPISAYHLDLLALYGATLGHLCMRKQAEIALEQRVAERTVQLAAANKELEAFSYSVSHDLRAPLRHIDGFARLLAQREGDRLDDTSARYLRVIGEAARKMGQLIDDLLAFSRMSRTEMQTRPVDLRQVVADIQHDLVPAMEGRAIEWRIGPLPVIRGDPALINVVFSNLLSNAVKYTAPRAQAQIVVDAMAGEGDEIVIGVGDNGVGFDMAYAHKLFGVFQRLHRDEEFEGTGIGLATVRRIINRHGGRAWATGALDSGATFYITLQRHKSEDADEKNPAG